MHLSSTVSQIKARGKKDEKKSCFGKKKGRTDTGGKYSCTKKRSNSGLCSICHWFTSLWFSFAAVFKVFLIYLPTPQEISVFQRKLMIFTVSMLILFI